MAQCKRCGEKAGLFVSYCTACKQLNDEDETNKRREQRDLELARQRELAETEREREFAAEQARLAAVERTIYELRERAQGGAQIFLYHSIYHPVDSVVLGQDVTPLFDIGVLRVMGLAGWEVVGVVPRTIGLALENKTVDPFGPVSYGGGMGGNVLGVHLLLRKEVTPTLDITDFGVREFVEAHFV